MKLNGILIILFFGFIFLAYSDENRPSDFVSLDEIDSGIVVEMRYYGNHNFIGKRIDGYEAPQCILTKLAAEALSQAQQELKQFALTLKVYDCYRPQMAVDHFVRWAKDLKDIKMKKEFYPDINKENLFKEGYIAEKSGHSRGSTLDLTLIPLPLSKQTIYTEGQKLVDCRATYQKRFKDNSLDMGTGYDCFDSLSNTANQKIGAEQLKNRLLLKALMEKHGFKNYDMEWWHFTLKDEPYPDRFFNFPVK